MPTVVRFVAFTLEVVLLRAALDTLARELDLRAVDFLPLDLDPLELRPLLDFEELRPLLLDLDPLLDLPRDELRPLLLDLPRDELRPLDDLPREVTRHLLFTPR